MSIPEWLNFIKDKFKDASVYSMVAEQVSLLEERIRLRDDQLGQLVAKITDLESQLIAARSDLAAATEDSSAKEKELAAFRQNEKFDVFQGVAFKRSVGAQNYEKSPRCPQCHSYLSMDHPKWTRGYLCHQCKYTVLPNYEVTDILKKIECGDTKDL